MDTDETPGCLHLSAVGFAAATLWLALLFSGCGYALTAQARAAVVVGVGLGSAGAEIHDARAASLDACEDEPCLDAGEARWAPALAAYESARAALTVWVESLDVARQVGEDDSVLAALLVAVARIAREWADLAAALLPLGVELPALPSPVAALLGGG